MLVGALLAHASLAAKTSWTAPQMVAGQLDEIDQSRRATAHYRRIRTFSD